MTAPLSPPAAATPPFHGKRLLYLTTGGIQAMLLPNWLSWLRTHYPHTEVRSVLTPSARRFVGTTAVAAVGGGGLPTIDVWPDEPDRALHVHLAAWPDAVLVHPATMHFIARLSLGLADTPALLALQCTRAPIVICPSLPPDGHHNPAYQRHILELSERENVTVLPPVNGTSVTTGQEGIGSAAFLPHALSALEDLRAWTQHDAS
ncbi:flavoprotein [Streptomyces sp. BK208]|uniref:flavoprotein n=1 Tax=Streptomyces sp. BK208 TaxID=2512150 RepID=UPI00105EDEEF|nr:flavoprotein [Streptomyces sp. BK208]TDT23071.1 flavoprotein [Streptomyces sp. BK208]